MNNREQESRAGEVKEEGDIFVLSSVNFTIFIPLLRNFGIVPDLVF